MADGDVLRLGIPGPYAQAYRQICAGSGNADEWARKTASGVKHFLTKYGEEPHQLIQAVASLLEPIARSPIPASGQTCLDLDREISRLQRAMSGHKVGMSLAASVCSSVLNDLERGARISNLAGELAHRFVDRVHTSTFVARVSAAPHHLENAERSVVQARMAEVKPKMDSYISSMAKQWLSPPENGRLRLPPRPRPAVDNDTEWE